MAKKATATASTVSTEKKAQKLTIISKDANLLPRQRRELEIRLNDLLAAEDAYTADNAVEEFNRALEDLKLMREGKKPFVSLLDTIELVEPYVSTSYGDKAFPYSFYVHPKHIRHAKIILRHVLMCIHDAHLMKTSDVRLSRLTLASVTMQEAEYVTSHYPHIFLDSAPILPEKQSKEEREAILKQKEEALTAKIRADLLAQLRNGTLSLESEVSTDEPNDHDVNI